MTASVFALTVIWIILGYLPWLGIIIFASLPFAYQLVTHVKKYHDRPDKVNNCKFLAVNFHFLSGLLLALGLIFST
jgi:1,4-dihydroxy-2-naphthoate octaprenyltransferase